MRLIDSDALPKWTGYALSATEVAIAVEHAPTIDAVPVEWIEKYAEYDDRFGSIYRMMEEWRKKNEHRIAETQKSDSFEGRI